jgi:hypothetical protein
VGYRRHLSWRLPFAKVPLPPIVAFIPIYQPRKSSMT